MKKAIYLATALIVAGVSVLGFAPKLVSAEAHTSLPIMISAVQISGGTGATSDDYIELFNPSSNPVVLAGVRLVKRSQAGTSDASIKSWSSTSTVEIPAKGFFLWANSGFDSISKTPDDTTSATVSSNNGVALRLGDLDSGQLIDSLSWGTSDNGFASSGLDNPTDNQAIVRNSLVVGEKSYKLASHNPRNSSVLLSDSADPDGTSGCSDSNQDNEGVEDDQTDDVGDETADSTSQDYSGIKISEIYAYPADGKAEFLELVNKGSSSVNLRDLIIKVSTRKQVLGNQTLDPGQMILFTGDNLKVALANNGQTVQILNPESGLLTEVVYPKTKKGESYALFGSDYKITKKETPGFANQLVGGDDQSGDDSGDDSTTDTEEDTDQTTTDDDSDSGTVGTISDGSSGGQSGNGVGVGQTKPKNPIVEFIKNLFGGDTSTDSDGSTEDNSEEGKAKNGLASAIALGLAVVGSGTYAMYKFGIAQHWPF